MGFSSRARHALRARHRRKQVPKKNHSTSLSLHQSRKPTYEDLSLRTCSGIGLGICQRLIDTFLATHPPSSHLVVLPTTRSTRKSADTVALLRKHLQHTKARPTHDALNRVHISSVQIDLCNLATIQRAADQLIHSTVSFEGLGDLRIPRLDAVIFNAGIGGWSHVSWIGFAVDIVKRGWIEATTCPLSKRSVPGLTVDPLPDVGKEQNAPTMGQVFCANVFGHYLFAHYLLPLVSREDDAIPPGRVIWQSSLDPSLWNFNLEDLQGLKSTGAYESSKMLTDILCLTSNLPSVKPYSSRYFKTPSETAKKPNVYLAHPGIVATTMFPLHFTLMWGYILGVLISRWLGSPWHPSFPYTAAVATTWLALSSQEELDSHDAGRVKWGSATDWWGNAMVKETEVDGWGWEGHPVTEADMRQQDAGVKRVLKKSVGRRLTATYPTEEKLVKFEELGAKCWAEMERLRAQWEERLRSKSEGSNGRS